MLPSSLVLYRRRSLWEAVEKSNRNISPMIILGSSCAAGLTAKGVVRVFASRQWMRLRMMCAWPAHSLRVVCASSAHRVRIVSEQSGNSAFGAMPGILVFSCPGFGRVLARMLRVLLSHVTDSTGSQQEETILRLGCAAYLQLVVDCRVLWLHPYA